MAILTIWNCYIDQYPGHPASESSASIEDVRNRARRCRRLGLLNAILRPILSVSLLPLLISPFGPSVSSSTRCILANLAPGALRTPSGASARCRPIAPAPCVAIIWRSSRSVLNQGQQPPPQGPPTEPSCPPPNAHTLYFGAVALPEELRLLARIAGFW